MIIYTNNTVQYCHYGNTAFDTNLFLPIKNPETTDYSIGKPLGGLWASRTNADQNWKKWAESNDFRYYSEDNKFCFHFKTNSKILFIETQNDIDAIPDQYILYQDDDLSNLFLKRFVLNFEKLKQDGFSAVELVWNMETAPYFRFWDCDSIIILDKNSIHPIN